MTITRAEFTHAGTRYAAVFEPMTEEDRVPARGHRNRRKSNTHYHLAVREVSGGQELALLVADYVVGQGCSAPKLYPGITARAAVLLRLAIRTFESAQPTAKYFAKECCDGGKSRCALCEMVRRLLDEDTAYRVYLRESGQWRDMEQKRRRTHCHHRGRRRAQAIDSE